MLRSLKDLEHYTVSATDGDLGSVTNFLLDDERWTVRYLVVETGGFFTGRRVLISPAFFQRAEWATRRFHLALTRDKIKNSPSIDVDKSVSRQHESEYYGYYGYPYYWGYTGLWGMGGSPGLLAPYKIDAAPSPAPRVARDGDAHLRSIREVIGYDIQGSDGSIGRVADFIVDDETWEVRYLVLDTSHWWLGKTVLVAPHWASRVSWDERKVFVDLSRQSIKDSPRWDPSAAVNREYETRLYDFYGRPTYWTDTQAPLEGSPPPRESSTTHA